MRAYEDLSGMRFGRLVATSLQGKNKHGFLLWRWRCDCGAEIDRPATPIKQGRQVSCGCHQREQSRLRATHGLSSSRTYRAWIEMRARCRGKDARCEKHYQERGITVAPEWDRSFPAFLADMGECPPSMTLDREDNDRGYAPGNCRWITHAEQVRNTRRTVRVNVDGAEMCLKDACATRGVPYQRILSRIRLGADPQEALDRPSPYRPYRRTKS